MLASVSKASSFHSSWHHFVASVLIIELVGPGFLLLRQ
jgi:hypothetical protein